ncbi:MAG: hypothetical protein ABIY52_06170 [Gemmatimonadaceae bacterium]
MIGSNALVTVAFLGSAASMAWSATVAWKHWLRHRFDSPADAGRHAENGLVGETRLHHLEATMHELGVELERMAEAQRFTARLLDERLAPILHAGGRPIHSESGRIDTPH